MLKAVGNHITPQKTREYVDSALTKNKLNTVMETVIAELNVRIKRLHKEGASQIMVRREMQGVDTLRFINEKRKHHLITSREIWQLSVPRSKDKLLGSIALKSYLRVVELMEEQRLGYRF